MPIDLEGEIRRTATRRLLYLVLLGGGAFILVSHSEFADQWGDHEWIKLLRVILDEGGKALIIAGVLGLVIDESLKKDLLRNAVTAALGYVLPDRLKPELGWVYGQKVMGQQSFHVRLEHLVEEHMVVLHGTVVRRIENICGETTRIFIGGGADEWFHQKGETTISACEWKRIPKDKRPIVTKIEPKRQTYGIGYEIGEIDIDPNETIETLMSYRLFVPDHGMELLTYRFAIDSPLVTVEAPPTLRYFVTFSHRDKYDEEALGSGPVSSIRLDRVMLPHQDIRVYWHRAKDVEERIEKYNLTI
jgi:hypothetical protein